MNQLEFMVKTRVLFICTQNAGRSQMAEGYLQARYGDRYEAFSAGTNPGRVSRKAVAVMNEIGIDISDHWSKSIDEFAGLPMDIVITLCECAHARCPVFSRAGKTIHRAFPDPGALAGDDETIMQGVREIRDEIGAWIDAEFGTV